MSVTQFDEGKFYISTGNGCKWSDYDGPFDTLEEAKEVLQELCGEWSSPEMLNTAVITVFKGGVLDLAKDHNGGIINGKQCYWSM